MRDNLVQVRIDASELRRALKDKPRKVPVIAREILTRLGIEGESSMKRQTPVDTGRLRASIRHGVASNYVEIGTDVKYAPFVLGDVPPFEIRPRRARALRFRIGKRIIFAKRVQHPGGQGILRQVATELEREYPQVVREVLRRHGFAR